MLDNTALGKACKVSIAKAFWVNRGSRNNIISPLRCRVGSLGSVQGVSTHSRPRSNRQISDLPNSVSSHLSDPEDLHRTILR